MLKQIFLNLELVMGFSWSNWGLGVRVIEVVGIGVIEGIEVIKIKD